MNVDVSKKSVFVIGGTNMDLICTPKNELKLRDSNIVGIGLSFGGVGRNIAENLARMGFSVSLMTAFGNDEYARIHRKHLSGIGVKLEHCITRANMSSGVYICLNDREGDMYIGMNDMAIFDTIKPEEVPLDAINACDACVIDTNIPQETIEHICRNVRVPVFADPVSSIKAVKLKNSLSRIHTIKPNAIEAEALTGIDDPVAAAGRLVGMGVKFVHISIGSDGTIVADADGVYRFSSGNISEKIVNTTGAGDSSTAALCAGYLLGYTMEQTLELSALVTSLTVRSQCAVSENITPELFQNRQ